MSLIQIQIGGQGTSQSITINQQISETFPALVNKLEDGLKQRSFTCQEIKEQYHSFIKSINELFCKDQSTALAQTKFIVFPFQTSPTQENLNNALLTEALLDTLSIISFSEYKCDIVHNHVNVKINDKTIFGLYFNNTGTFDLIDNYTRLLKSLMEEKTRLPSEFTCIILHSIGSEDELDEHKINNIVTDIMGKHSSYIKPLQVLKSGKPRCIRLTSSLLKNVASVTEATGVIRKILNV